MWVRKPAPTKNPFMPTVDHVIPKSRQPGSRTLVVCRQCNSDKGSHLLDEWLELLRTAGDPRAEHVARQILLWTRT